MIQRTTRKVLDDHLSLAQQGDLDTDIVRNFDPECVLMTTYGNFHGHVGVREAARLLERQIGRRRYNYLHEECHEQLAEWTAETERAEIPDGADSYWIRDGKIRAMTIHYSVHEKDGQETLITGRAPSFDTSEPAPAPFKPARRIECWIAWPTLRCASSSGPWRSGRKRSACPTASALPARRRRSALPLRTAPRRAACGRSRRPAGQSR